MKKSVSVASEEINGDNFLNNVEVDHRLCTGIKNNCCFKCLTIVREALLK